MADASTRIGVKQAVTSAMDFVLDLYDGQSLRDLLLEEVEMDQAHNKWLVTIGFSLANEESTSILTPSTRKLARHYKVIAVDSRTGHTMSMKIREPRGV